MSETTDRGTCPPEEQIVRLSEGAAVDASVRSHIEACETCSVLAAALLQGTQPVTAPAQTPEPEEGAKRGPFVVLSRVGAGNMGVVYRAVDPRLQRFVALKIIRPGGGTLHRHDSRARLLREAQALAQVAHPNVVRIYDVGEDQGDVFIAMEFIEGQTLGLWRKAAQRSVADCVNVLLAAGHGLLAAHRAGLLHRDFKPDNILVRPDGSAVVTDFGLARSITSAEAAPPGSGADSTPLDSMTVTGALVGTPSYMAPEQFSGQPPTARSDQYALGVVLYELLTGERPFGAGPLVERLALMQAGLFAPALARLPPLLRSVLDCALKPNRLDRYPSLEPLLEDLQGVVAPKRGRRVLAGAALAVAMALGVLSARWLTPVETCRGTDAPLVAVWNERARTELRAGLAQEPSFALSAIEGLDGWATAWAAQRREACEATRTRAEQPESDLLLRQECLDRMLNHFDLTRSLLAQGGVAQGCAADVLASLPSLAACADVQSLKQAGVGTTSPENRRKAEALRPALLNVHGLNFRDQRAEALSLALDTVRSARALAFAPVLIEALEAQASVLTGMGSLAEAQELLREAVYAADAAGLDRQSVHVRAVLLSLKGMAHDRGDDGEAHSKTAASVLRRLGEPRELAVELDTGIGSWLVARGDIAQAMTRLERAVALSRSVFPPHDVRLIRALDALGANYSLAMRPADALASHREAFQLAKAHLNAGHPLWASAMLNLSGAHLRLGHASLAQAHAKDLVALLRKSGQDRTVNSLVARSLLAQSLNMTGALNEALATATAVLDDCRVIAECHSGMRIRFLEARAAVSLNQGRLDDAEGAYREALALDAEAPSTLGKASINPVRQARNLLRVANRRRDAAKIRFWLPRLPTADSETDLDALEIALVRHDGLTLLGKTAEARAALPAQVPLIPGGDSPAADARLSLARWAVRTGRSELARSALDLPPYDAWELAFITFRVAQAEVDLDKARALGERARASFASLKALEVRDVDRWLQRLHSPSKLLPRR